MSASAGAADPARPLSRSFHFFLWTRMLSTASNQILLVALGWQMYDLTGSAWDLGLVGLLQFIPTVAFTIPSGQLADRVDRRRIISAAIAVMLCAAGLLAWGSVGHWIGANLIFGVSVLLGLARALLISSLVAPGERKAQLAEAAAIMDSLPGGMKRWKTYARLREEIAGEQKKRP